MAIFGFDFYGETKYGAPFSIDFGIEPFTAVANSHDHITVSWSEPTGNWTKFRLLVNRSGYSINEDDGNILLNITSGKTPGQYVDTIGGKGWYYYTVFILNDDLVTWERAGTAFALAAADYGSTDALWGLTPEWYRTIRDNTAGYSPTNYAINPALYLSQSDSVDNLTLQRFLSVFGWGLDILRTQADTILDGYDTSRMHMDRLAMLSAEFGAELERSVPAKTSRSLVRNLGLLYRKRGTQDGIQEMLALATGWICDVNLGPNYMLSEDQANFINPVIETWDKGTRYVTGDKVVYNSYNYTALLTAYGPAQKPPNAGGDNTYWQQDATVEENIDLVRGDTGNIGTWEALALTAGVPLTTVTSTHIGRGVTHPTDPGNTDTNALGIKNTSGATDDLLIRSVPYYLEEVTFDRELVQSTVIPQPVATQTFNFGTFYHYGDLVNFAGIIYKALRDTYRYPLSSDWVALGYDRRQRTALSFYTHGKFVGSDTTNLVTPYVIAFDDQGDYLFDVTMDPSQYTHLAFDTFNMPQPFDQGRPFDFGATWTDVDGTWQAGWEFNNTGFIAPTSTGKTFGMVVGQADTKVGITYRSAGTRMMGLLFRCSDTVSLSGTIHPHNYWIAHQSGLQRVIGDVLQTADATWTPFADGDRMIVALSGSSIVVKKNAVVIATVTNTYNQTATRHGVIAL